jgi:hypothetical protein
MIFMQSLKTGFSRAGRTKRMVFLAWLVSLLLGLTLAFPLLGELDRYISPTLLEEKLAGHYDENAIATMKADREGSIILDAVDPGMMGFGSFMTVYDRVLNGTAVKSVGGVLYDLVFRLSVDPGSTILFTMLLLLYALAWTYLAGGFVGIYAKDPYGSISDFLKYGAKYFGRYFRLSLIALILYALLFTLVFDNIRLAIARGTANDPSEMTPFVYYMVKNGVVLLVLGLLTMCFDYAKIRIVVEERASVFGALFRGAGFAFKKFASTAPLYLMLVGVGVILIAVLALLDRWIPQTSYWTILLFFLILQLYMAARFWLKAATYAAEADLFQQLTESPASAVAAMPRISP